MDSIVKLIHEDACGVLLYTGVKCENEKIKETFEASQMAFFDETTGRIHITEKLIDYCLEVAPKKHNHPIPDRSFGGGGTAAYLRQADDNIKLINEIHTAEIFKIAEEFKIPFMFKACGKVEETDIDIMRKYYNGYIYTGVQIYKDHETTKRQISKLLNDKNICTAHTIIISPLSFMPSSLPNTDKLFMCLENNLPIYLATMPISCLTGPATMYSLAVLAWAEFLAELCLCQLKMPGIMVINGALPTAGDPRSKYQAALGSIFHNLCNYTITRVANLFSLPTIQSGCTISGYDHQPNKKTYTDPETYNGFLLWNKLKDWHQLRHCFGFVNILTDFDIYKMRRDCVTLQEIQKKNLEYQYEIEEVFYDPEAQESISQGVEFGFRNILHTTKHIGLLSEYLTEEEKI